MSGTVLVQYDTGADEVFIPACGVLAVRGRPVAVPADVAGREPGRWETLPPDGRPDLGDGRAWQFNEQVNAWESRDLGDGLLGQVDMWRRAPAPDKKITNDSTEG